MHRDRDRDAERQHQRHQRDERHRQQRRAVPREVEQLLREQRTHSRHRHRLPRSRISRICPTRLARPQGAGRRLRAPASPGALRATPAPAATSAATIAGVSRFGVRDASASAPAPSIAAAGSNAANGRRGCRSAIAGHSDDEAPGRQPAPQRGRTIEREEPVVKDGDAIGEPLGFVQIVRRHEDRAAGGAPLFEQPPHAPRDLRIEPGRRLVEQQHSAARGAALAPARPSAASLSTVRRARVDARSVSSKDVERPIDRRAPASARPYSAA